MNSSLLQALTRSYRNNPICEGNRIRHTLRCARGAEKSSVEMYTRERGGVLDQFEENKGWHVEETRRKRERARSKHGRGPKKENWV